MVVPMPSRRTILNVAKALAVVLVLGVLYFVLRGIGFRNILDAARGADVRSLVWAGLLFMVVFWLRAFRWHLLMKRQERKGMLYLFPMYMAGVFGNTVTPGARVGGEAVRAYYMSRVFGGEKSAYLGTILADKLGHSAVFLALLLAAGVTVVVLVPTATALKVVLLVVVGLAVAGVVSGLLLRRYVDPREHLLGRLLPFVYNVPPLGTLRRRFATYEHFEDYIVRKLDNIVTPVAEAAGSPKALTKIILLTCAAWALFFLAHDMMFRGLGAPVGYWRVAVIVIIATLAGDVSVSPGGAGFMETAMIGLCTAFGVESDTAAAVTLISRGIYFACALGIGGACMAGLSLVYGKRGAPAQ